MPRARLNCLISSGLRAQLEESRERAGRSMTAEVEARLRDSLNSRHSDGLVLLRVDEGLMAWLNALDRNKMFGINFNEMVLYLLRCRMQDLWESDVWFKDIVDHLDEPWRSNCRETPRYQRLKNLNTRPWEQG